MTNLDIDGAEARAVLNIKLSHQLRMIFIVLYKFRRTPTKKDVANADKVFKKAARKGVKAIGTWWTLGRFDAVRVIEAKDVKQVMAINLQLQAASSETLVAVTRRQAVELL